MKTSRRNKIEMDREKNKFKSLNVNHVSQEKHKVSISDFYYTLSASSFEELFRVQLIRESLPWDKEMLHREREAEREREGERERERER